jgi:hypothetical protein
VDNGWQGRRLLVDKRDAGLLGRAHLKHADNGFKEPQKIDIGGAHLQLAGLDLCHVQHIVDQCQKALTAGMNHFDRTGVRPGQGGITLTTQQQQQVGDALAVAAYHAQTGVPVLQVLLSDDAAVYDPRC